MRQDIFFVKCLCKAIYSIVAGNYLKLCYAENPTEKNNCHKLQLTTESVLHKGYVVIVQMPTCRLYVGQPVFVLPSDKPVRWGHIAELQVDYLSVNEVSPFSWYTQDVGIRLSFAFPRNTKDTQLFVLNKIDPSIWR